MRRGGRLSTERNAPPGRADEGRLRVRQVFMFLRSLAAGRAGTARTLEGASHRLRLHELPAHPAIEREPVLRVRRPELTPAPAPPEVLAGWVLRGWEQPDGRVTVWQARRRGVGSKQESEGFADDPARPAALDQWSRAWKGWAAAERPTRAAMRVFEQLYALQADIERQGERIELLLGDGRLQWKTEEGSIDHPVLLQRVDLVFDPDLPEFRVIDADRPPELYAPLLLAAGHLSGEKLHELERELHTGGFHPLGGEPTTAFLRRLASLLGAQGTLRERSGAGQGAADGPVITRDPVLFARNRAAGMAAALDRALEDIERGRELPPGLLRVVGAGGGAEPAAHAAGAELLLSKPANDEQIEVLRALDRHAAVLVQGPPGTGKSHTIANLVGHLAAQGKRVLVTSYTTKALRIVRELVVPQLRPLCVALLDNDLEGRTQLEQSIRGIVERLSSSTEARLAAEVAALEERRRQIAAEVERLTTLVREAQENEYRPVVLAGVRPAGDMAPAEAARHLEQNAHRLDLVPGPVPAGPPPLSPDELRELYQSNDALSSDDERELSLELPAPGLLPAPDELEREVAGITAAERAPSDRFWRAPPDPGETRGLQRLLRGLEQLGRDIAALAPWQRRLVAAGHAGEAETRFWRQLAAEAQQAAARWTEARPLLLAHNPTLDPALPRAQALAALAEIHAHVGADDKKAKLGGLSLLFRGSWKAVLEGCRVNGRPPGEAAHFAALHAQAAIEQGRAELDARWARQAEPAGLPAFSSLPDPPERAAAEYAQQFEGLLELWPGRWAPLEAQLRELGFEFGQFRADEVARAVPARPFERDLAVIGVGVGQARVDAGPLATVLSRRLEAGTRLEVLRRLKGLADDLGRFPARVCRTLRSSLGALDVDSYRREYRRLEQARAGLGTLARRRALLEKLAASAPGWAAAVQARRGIHGAPLPPRELEAAWRWRQLHDELDRRSEGDEAAAAARLELQRQLLDSTTVELVDARAWLAQLRRTGVEARQALTGWADTQRTIDKALDKGAGKPGERLPALQMKALALLAKAREAVPVWIMPLSRVAECFDPRQPRFDVVVIDEASQCDLTGLFAVYLGKQVAIVGDHEQVSPAALELPASTSSAASAEQLIGQFLSGIPNSHLYVPSSSVYDLARQSFAGIIGLREHFRCVPDIIEFSNQIAYGGEIRPLRDPGSAPRPHLCEYRVSQALAPVRKGDVNEAEARAVAALLAAALQLPEYEGKTFGAISLLSDQQGRRIQELVQTLVPVAELQRRRFLAGSAGQFQGDERDVMFLSMVDVPSGAVLGREERLNARQRYNVAASRARDQLWLVHSLDPRRDLSASDLRRRLIEHVRGPAGGRREGLAPASAPPARTPSALEQAVFQGLVQEGFEVAPQVAVGGYRIDLVVSDGEQQVALACDGDRVLPLDHVPAELAKQAALERVGWRVRRIRATRFYRDPDGTMAALVKELRRLGLAPGQGAGAEGLAPGEDLQNRIIRGAWQILRAESWVVEAPDMAAPVPPPLPGAAVAELVVDETTDPHFVIVEQPPSGDGQTGGDDPYRP